MQSKKNRIILFKNKIKKNKYVYGLHTLQGLYP